MKTFAAIALLATSLVACSQNHETQSETASSEQEDSLNWIDDAAAKQLVLDYAKAGQPELIATDECFAGQAQLGGSDYCMEPVKLPAQVLKQIVKMNAQRFDNVSDYDQRITKLYVFNHAGNLGTYIDEDEARGLAESLSIPSELIGAMSVKSYSADDRSFLSLLTGLTVDESFQDETLLHGYAKELIAGKKAKVFTFGPDEITLYPGGGFGILFQLIITDDHMIYIKNEGWNS